MGPKGTVVRRLAGILAVLLLWELVVIVFQIRELFLPKASIVVAKIGQLAVTENFWLDVGFSVGRVLAAFLVSVVLALPLALLANQSMMARPIIETLTDIFRYVPVPAMVPLTILLFGVGEVSKIALLFLGTFFQLLLLFADNIKAVPNNYRDMFYCLRLSPAQTLTRTVRAAAPGLYDSCRIAIGWCWTYVIIAELVAAQYGIGHAIKEFQRFSDSPGVYAGIVVMAIIGFSTDLIFRSSSRWLFPYLREHHVN